MSIFVSVRSLVVAAALAAGIGIGANDARAQQSNCCCSAMSNYQWYSYAPAAPAPVQGVAAQQGASVPAGSASAVPAGQAQTANAQGQTYRRYSYQPAQGQAAAAQAVPSQVFAPSYSPAPTYYSQPYGVSSYSNGTSSYSPSHRKLPWEYAKGDPRRYRP